ncbi:hypothetical protein K1T71_009953 [Dendrolimus kikuchii]|uniref:Uncharacterized protein n=1 Tax=Dendrolimus kikuchii TaxID=765133 RepID=A0ACC1CTU1_9NEOP|nr:hypothetical protein K1T71_009953 [Dendrolimus kikuchii]
MSLVCVHIGAWRRLQKAYEDRGLCRKLGLLRTLFGLKLELFKSMENYLMQTPLKFSQSSTESNSTPESDPTWTPNMGSDSCSDEFEDTVEQAAIATTMVNCGDEPLTIPEALSGPECDHWKAAKAVSNGE